MKLPLDFYLQEDVVKVSRQLLGKVLCTRLNNQLTSGIITETEAYEGVTDKASHAFGGRLTDRTKTMFKEGGVAYVYLCYGIHHLFNVVTHSEGTPHAVLIRAIQPLDGIEIMEKRRKMKSTSKSFSGGPGSLTVALGINTKHTGTDLLGEKIWIEDRGIKVNQKEIIVGPRVGVAYAGEDALLPYRFIWNISSTKHM
jgi:DNA-3-methyladenine glycosylase